MKIKTTLAFVTLSALCFFYFTYAPSRDDAPKETQPRASDTNALPSFVNVVETVAESASKGRQTLTTLRYLSSSRGGDVKGQGGTILRFSPNSFVDAGGKTITGKVRVEIEEYYDLTSILQAKLSTSSGEKLIETAGMINVKAYCGKSEVFLNQGSLYQVYFPRRGNQHEDFELFYGRWKEGGQIDWIAAGNEQQDRLDTSDTELKQPTPTTQPQVDRCFVQISESIMRRGNRISKMDYFNWQLTTGQTLNQWFVANFNPDLKMLSDYCSNALRTQITFHVNQKGKFVDYYISQSSIPEYDRKIAAFLASMPALELGVLMPVFTEDHACVLTFSAREMKAADAVGSNFRRQYADQEVMTNVNTSDLDYYIFTSSELGWINCDRFLPEEFELVDMRVIANGGSDGLVSMVFDEMNSVLNGRFTDGEFLFTGIPAGQKVRLIGIDNSGGSPLVAVKEMVTDSKVHSMDDYRRMNLKELNLCFKVPDLAASTPR